MAPTSIMISLIMTVLNREQYLPLAIESILKQTYSDFELIIWDDGSTDFSMEIAYNYSVVDSRIRAIATEHRGRAPALKAAHSLAKGEYLGWVDSDDMLAPTALEETALVLDANPEIGLVYSDYLVIDEKGEILGIGHRCGTPYSKETLLKSFMTFHFRLFRSDAFARAGGINSSFKYAPDYDLCLRLSEVTKVEHLQRPLYFYRNHSDCISNLEKVKQLFWSHKAQADAISRRKLFQPI